MPVTLSIEFDDTWAARLRPMVEHRVREMRRHPLTVMLLENMPGVESVDDLTLKQKAKLLIRFHLLKDLVRFEAQAAAEAANRQTSDEIVSNFPMEIGEP